MKKTIYIAGASSEAEVIRVYMTALRDRGWGVVHDWTESVVTNAARGLRDQDLTPAEQRTFAAKDLAAVREADFFWLLTPGNGHASTGCWVELGHALAGGSRIFVSGGQRSIFQHLALMSFDAHEEAIRHLEGIP